MTTKVKKALYWAMIGGGILSFAATGFRHFGWLTFTCLGLMGLDILKRNE